MLAGVALLAGAILPAMAEPAADPSPAAASFNAASGVGYISDELTVPLRSGPSGNHRILHRGLPAGTRLEVLGQDEESGFIHVRTPRGTEGWVPQQFVVGEPIARDRLLAANREIERLKRLIADRDAQIADMADGEIVRQIQLPETVRQQVNALLDELSALETAAAGVETRQANEKLMELNQRLRDEVEKLVAEHNALQSNLQQRWLLIGAGLLLLGLVLGLVIKARPRRSAWN